MITTAAPAARAAMLISLTFLSACEKKISAEPPHISAAAPSAPATPVPATGNTICQLDSPGMLLLDTCKDGDVLAFLPARWGNEQLPIFAASQLCNFNKAVVYNNVGVTCIYTGVRVRARLDKEKKDQVGQSADTPRKQ